MSAKRENGLAIFRKTARLRRVCGRDARGPSSSLDASRFSCAVRDPSNSHRALHNYHSRM